ncbi:hypothetical protein HCN44_004500 [Aphidius gifuensis]|uniref:Alpha-carbonic anhydrase domain-containing protein n=1 Tax=Aphidius gifuensis TaxID=684658 RepID=A0A835CV57_APHGI|nr:hypothetical protein HCN44_004500 [Aphidius gifuensis]
MQWLITLVFLILGIHVTLQSPDGWGYTDKHGPKTWEGICQLGTRQSPIDIVDDDTLEADLGPLEFIKYDHLYNATVTNNGHTIQVALKGQPLLSGGGLETNYQLDQMHFHWEAEHTINGYRDPLELHLVHYNKKYNNFTTALKHENSISVVAVLFEKSEVDNKHLQPIIDAAKQVSNWELKSKIDIDVQGTVLPTLFIPADRTMYYRYDGSLTTPTCQEIVTWFIMTEKLPVSVSQVSNQLVLTF